VRFYVFFDASLNGLEVGAPVKFKGVRIGSVDAIDIVYDDDVDKACASVLLGIDATSLRTMKRGRISNKDYREFYSEQISRGLAAKLALESIVTGKNFVALDYYPGENERYFKEIDGLKYQQMPTMRTDFDEFIANVDSTVKSISQINFSEISECIALFLNKFQSVLDQLDLRRMSIAFSESCENLSEILRDAKVKNIVHGLETAIGKFNFRFDGVVDEISGAFSGLRTMLGGDSSFRRSLEGNLLQLERMLRSLREFLDFLERNPNAIFTGKHL
jgi:paraquat-inducible protein B